MPLQPIFRDYDYIYDLQEQSAANITLAAETAGSRCLKPQRDNMVLVLEDMQKKCVGMYHRRSSHLSSLFGSLCACVCSLKDAILSRSSQWQMQGYNIYEANNTFTHTCVIMVHCIQKQPNTIFNNSSRQAGLTIVDQVCYFSFGPCMHTFCSHHHPFLRAILIVDPERGERVQ